MSRGLIVGVVCIAGGLAVLALVQWMLEQGWSRTLPYLGLAAALLVGGAALIRNSRRSPTALAPITRGRLEAIIMEELPDCSSDLRAYFESVRVVPARWRLSPWGDDDGGFWVVARDGRRVLWWNAIEGGWNVSTFEVEGRIPDDQYWCNQDPLNLGLERLLGEAEGGFGPPQPIRPDLPSSG